jgi:hypothetical protein
MGVPFSFGAGISGLGRDGAADICVKGLVMRGL